MSGSPLLRVARQSAQGRTPAVYRSCQGVSVDNPKARDKHHQMPGQRLRDFVIISYNIWQVELREADFQSSMLNQEGASLFARTQCFDHEKEGTRPRSLALQLLAATRRQALLALPGSGLPPPARDAGLWRVGEVLCSSEDASYARLDRPALSTHQLKSTQAPTAAKIVPTDASGARRCLETDHRASRMWHPHWRYKLSCYRQALSGPGRASGVLAGPGCRCNHGAATMTANKPRRGNQRRGQFEAPGHYRTFYVKAWGAPHHRALSDVQEHVYLKLTIGPKACSLPGLVLLGRGAVGDLFKYDASVLDSALSGLQSHGNLLIDWPHQVIWAPFALLEQQYVASPKTATGWCSNLTNVPSASPLRPRIIADIASYLSMLGPSFVESLERLVGPEPTNTHGIPYQLPSIEPSQVPSSESESQATPITRSSILPTDTELAAHVTQRQAQHDAVKLHSPTTLQHFVDFIRVAGLADDLTDLQRQSFAQLAESNRTMAHLRTALERTQRRATATRVANPVGYLLRTTEAPCRQAGATYQRPLLPQVDLSPWRPSHVQKIFRLSSSSPHDIRVTTHSKLRLTLYSAARFIPPDRSEHKASTCGVVPTPCPRSTALLTFQGRPAWTALSTLASPSALRAGQVRKLFEPARMRALWTQGNMQLLCAAQGRDPTGDHVNALVLHWDGCSSSAQSNGVLRSLGLSAHLLVDGVGTVYQLMDLARTKAFEAG
ncbi:hypothetical protein Q3G72_034190 [Acer saccharum]|nr:hypothetical protein Q3G72_034190 [Acer saccharum]